MKVFKRTTRTRGTKRRYRASDSDDDTDDDEIVQKGNTVYFYSEVTRESVLKLTLALEKAAMAALNHSSLTSDPYVELFINSDGGDAYAGLSGMDHIRNSKVPVHTVADGFVASAATFLLLGGRRRYAMANASVLIHQLSAYFNGKYCELKDELQNSKAVMKTFRRIYRSSTKLTDEQLDNLLSKELALDSKKCLKYGFVDFIVQNEPFSTRCTRG